MSTEKELDSLFKEFPNTSKKEWIDKVTVDLKGADFDKKLVWKTQEGFQVKPFYMQSDIERLAYLKGFQNLNENSDVSSESPRSWLNFEMVDASNADQAKKLASEAQEMGANGINYLFPKNSRPVLKDLTEGTFQQNYMLTTEDNLETLASQLKEFLDNNKNSTGNFGLLDYDPIKTYSKKGKTGIINFDSLQKLISEPGKPENLKLFAVHADHFLNAGANSSLELGLLLSVIVEYFDQLTERGCSPSEILNSLFIYLGTGTNYFMEIAKIKALRVLVYNIAASYGIENYNPGKLHIHCHTSLWTKTIYDPYVNMLRNTTESMSAILGGCDSISIAPFDKAFSKPSNFSRRIARNISNLLKEESYFDKVVDPVAGSYYIESLTDQLIEKSLEIFKVIEDNGGYIKSFQAGEIQKMISDSRKNKFKAIGGRRGSLIGTNKYPNTSETIDEKELAITAEEFDSNDTIIETREAIQFESIRLATDKYAKSTGKAPKVFLSLIGENAIMRKARATFSAGFFGCAGYEVIESAPSPDIFKAVEKAIMSKSDIVVICGADDDYLTLGSDFAKAYKPNHKSILVVAGNPENTEALEEAGVDQFISIRTNLIESLQNFQKKLNIN